MTSTKNIVVIGDIDSLEFYHVGDEAMLEANLTRIRQHHTGIQFTLISADPATSSRLYNSLAIPQLGFPKRTEGTAFDRDTMLSQIIEAAQIFNPTRQDTPFFTILNAFYNADGLLISGGGNLSSTWPEHLYERVALLKIANLFQKPAVVTGQTIGPSLTKHERDLLADALAHAAYVGLREVPSLQLAQILGLENIHYQLDDAFFLKASPISKNLGFDVGKPYIAVTISPFVNPQENPTLVAQFAAELEAIAIQTNAPLVFIPHVGKSRHDRLSDTAMSLYLRDQIKNASVVADLPIYGASEVVWLTQNASIIISTRYHPLVFGISGQVPSLGLYVDEYTRVKLTGALAHGGLEQWALPIEAAHDGLLVEAAQEVWLRRDEIRKHLAAQYDNWRQQYTTYWSEILSALNINQNSLSAQAERIMPIPPTLSPSGPWHRVSKMIAQYKQQRDAQYEGILDNFRRAEEYALSLEKITVNHQQDTTAIQEIFEAHNAEIGNLHALIAARETENTALHEAFSATHQVVQAYEEESAVLKALIADYDKRIIDLQETLISREAELSTLKNSRLYRLNRNLNNWLSWPLLNRRSK